MPRLLLAFLPLSFFVLALSVNIRATHAETDVVYKKIATSQTIRCGYAEWPPFMTIDPNTKKVSGLLYDVWELVGKKLGLKIEWSSPLGWGEITEAVTTGKVDAFCVGVWPDTGRTKNLLLSRPVFYTPIYLYARDGDNRFDKGTDILNDSKFAVAGQDGDFTATLLGLKFPKARQVNISPMQQQGEMLLNVASGKADVTVVDVPYAHEYMAQNPHKLKRVKAPPLGIVPLDIPLAVGEYQLKSMIDAVLNDLINDGTIAALIKKWHAEETYPPIPEVQIPAPK